MSIVQRYDNFKDLPTGPERREAVHRYVIAHKGIVERIAKRAPVHRTVVSKVLHGRCVSAPVVAAIQAEESEMENNAAELVESNA